MSLTIEEFRNRLTDSGILSRADMDAFDLSAAGKQAGETPDALAQALMEADRLTAFQADALLAENARPVKLGNYRLMDVIGQGGMGQVYKAIHERMERIVAIKVLPPLAALDEGLVARFRREVQVAAKLHHPHIVTAYDADEAGGLHFLVMEYVAGQDLGQAVSEHGPLPLDRALDYTLQVARALQYAHGEGVLHRDIKPANLLVDGSGHVRVLDMGLARLESSDGLTVSGEVLGTAATMAPEQGDDVRQVDERSDIYGLGCTLYYLLGGRHMYEGDSALQVLIAHAKKPIPDIGAVCKEATPDLQRFFEGMVQKSKEDRYADMQAVIDALVALRGGDVPDAPPRTRRRAQTPRRVWWLAGAAAVVAIMIGAIVILTGSDSTTPVEPTLRHVLVGQGSSIRSLAFHPDGKRLLSGSKGGSVGIWDIEAGTLEGRLGVERDPPPPDELDPPPVAVRTVLCLRDGKTVITSCDDGLIRIWDLDSREVTKVLRGHQSKVRDIGIAPDESWLASASKDGTVRIWDLPAGTERLQQRGTSEHENDTLGVLSLDVRSDGMVFATTGFDRVMRIWNPATLDVDLQVGPQSADPGGIVFTPNGQFLIYDPGYGELRVLTGDGMSEINVLRGHAERVFAIAVSPDSDLVATGGSDTTVKLWRLPSCELITTLRGHMDGLDTVAFNQDGSLLASGSGDNTIRLYDLR